MEKKQRCDGGDLLGGGSGGGGELIQKILNRLPVKSLGQLKLVSKSWCALIESPFFFIDDDDLHTNNTFIFLSSHTTTYSTKTHSYHPEHSLIMISESDDSVGQLKLDNLGFPKFEDFSKSITDLGLPQALKSVEFSKRLIGSCNGLVCLYDSILNEVSLYNPATRQFKILPRAIKIVKDDLPNHLVGFGFDVETKDYKVVLITGLRWDSYYRPKKLPIECICRVQVYSLSTDSWKLLEGTTSLPGFPFFSYPSEVVCLGSCCFFLAQFFHTKQQRCIPINSKLIISFDFTKEIFTPLELPDHHPHQQLYLSVFGGTHKKIALFAVATNPPPGGDSYNPDTYELHQQRANYSAYPETYEPPKGYFYSEVCGREDYSIWVLDVDDEHVGCCNKESWIQWHSFQLEHQIPGERTSPSCIILNDGEFLLLETRTLNGCGKKLKIYNLVTKEVIQDFLTCSKVMSRAYAYKPSPVNFFNGGEQPHACLQTKPSLVKLMVAGQQLLSIERADRVIENAATNL